MLKFYTSEEFSKLSDDEKYDIYHTAFEENSDILNCNKRQMSLLNEREKTISILKEILKSICEIIN